MIVTSKLTIKFQQINSHSNHASHTCMHEGIINQVPLLWLEVISRFIISYCVGFLQSWQLYRIIEAKHWLGWSINVQGSIIDVWKSHFIAKIRAATSCTPVTKLPQTEIEVAVTSSVTVTDGPGKVITTAVHSFTPWFGTVCASTSRVAVAKELYLHHVLPLSPHQGTYLQNFIIIIIVRSSVFRIENC